MRSVPALALLAILGCAAAPPPTADDHAAHEAHHEASVDPGSTAIDPSDPAAAIRHEMRLLERAMHASISAIAAGDLSEIPGQLHAIHGAKDGTQAAIRSGAYRPPLGGDRLEQFVALDDAFHRHLVRLLVASKSQDLAGAAAAVGQAVAGCVGCHAEFKGPAVAAE